jgi:imidazolonepropionase
MSQNYPISIKAVFGAHAIPLEYKEDQDTLIFNQPNASRNLQNNPAHFIDVFCETGYFTVEKRSKL